MNQNALFSSIIVDLKFCQHPQNQIPLADLLLSLYQKLLGTHFMFLKFYTHSSVGNNMSKVDQLTKGSA